MTTTLFLVYTYIFLMLFLLCLHPSCTVNLVYHPDLQWPLRTRLAEYPAWKMEDRYKKTVISSYIGGRLTTNRMLNAVLVRHGRVFDSPLFSIVLGKKECPRSKCRVLGFDKELRNNWDNCIDEFTLINMHHFDAKLEQETLNININRIVSQIYVEKSF